MQSQHDTGAKARLMEAGRTIFAEHGPEKARIRDICALAGTNVAAVNYHFGGKNRFYITVLAENMSHMMQRHPLLAGLAPESTPRDKLQAFIWNMLEHFLTEEDDISTRLSKLVLQEMIHPSEYFDEIIEQHIRPVNLHLFDIIQDILPDAPRDIVSRCVASIMAQFVLFRFDTRLRNFIEPEFSLQANCFEHAAQAIFEFSLGGIEGLRSLYG